MDWRDIRGERHTGAFDGGWRGRVGGGRRLDCTDASGGWIAWIVGRALRARVVGKERSFIERERETNLRRGRAEQPKEGVAPRPSYQM